MPAININQARVETRYMISIAISMFDKAMYLFFKNQTRDWTG